MIPQTGIGRFLFFLHIALIAAQWLVPLAAMSSLPEQIPVHFDSQGNPDRFASKGSSEFWFVPMMGTLLGVLTMVLIRFHRVYHFTHNAEVSALPEEKLTRPNDLMREMLLWIFVIIQTLILTAICLIIAFATDETLAFPWAVVVTCVGAPIGILTLYLIRVARGVDASKREAGIS